MAFLAGVRTVSAAMCSSGLSSIRGQGGSGFQPPYIRVQLWRDRWRAFSQNAVTPPNPATFVKDVTNPFDTWLPMRVKTGIPVFEDDAPALQVGDQTLFAVTSAAWSMDTQDVAPTALADDAFDLRVVETPWTPFDPWRNKQNEIVSVGNDDAQTWLPLTIAPVPWNQDFPWVSEQNEIVSVGNDDTQTWLPLTVDPIPWTQDFPWISEQNEIVSVGNDDDQAWRPLTVAAVPWNQDFPWINEQNAIVSVGNDDDQVWRPLLPSFVPPWNTERPADEDVLVVGLEDDDPADHRREPWAEVPTNVGEWIDDVVPPQPPPPPPPPAPPATSSPGPVGGAGGDRRPLWPEEWPHLRGEAPLILRPAAPLVPREDEKIRDGLPEPSEPEPEPAPAPSVVIVEVPVPVPYPVPILIEVAGAPSPAPETFRGASQRVRHKQRTTTTFTWSPPPAALPMKPQGPTAAELGMTVVAGVAIGFFIGLLVFKPKPPALPGSDDEDDEA